MADSLRKLTVIAFVALPAVLQAQEDDASLANLLGAGDSSGFEKAIAPRRFEFPADHGPHESFRNEWWYVTGNLDADDGRRFGFELTIFRFSLTPAPPDADSAWRTNQVYIAHFAITDAERERFFVAERYSRGATGLSGASADPFRVWIDDWQIVSAAADGGMPWRLVAAGDGFEIDVELVTRRPPVLNGVDGLSQKSDEPGNASYYYSLTRLQTDGTIVIDGESFKVSGLSWLDREWSSSALAADQQGWDWFALQLDDGSELMFYNLRKTDGSQGRNSAGTRVRADGTSAYLSRGEVDVAVTRTWDSPEGGTYPAGWTLTVPAEGLVLDVVPVMADQELFTTVRYWEGAVDVSGRRRGEAVSGRGYVELTGYAD